MGEAPQGKAQGRSGNSPTALALYIGWVAFRRTCRRRNRRGQSWLVLLLQIIGRPVDLRVFI